MVLLLGLEDAQLLKGYGSGGGGGVGGGGLVFFGKLSIIHVCFILLLHFI